MKTMNAAIRLFCALAESKEKAAPWTLWSWDQTKKVLAASPHHKMIAELEALHENDRFAAMRYAGAFEPLNMLGETYVFPSKSEADRFVEEVQALSGLTTRVGGTIVAASGPNTMQIEAAAASLGGAQYNGPNVMDTFESVDSHLPYDMIMAGLPIYLVDRALRRALGDKTTLIEGTDQAHIEPFRGRLSQFAVARKTICGVDARLVEAVLKAGLLEPATRKAVVESAPASMRGLLMEQDPVGQGAAPTAEPAAPNKGGVANDQPDVRTGSPAQSKVEPQGEKTPPTERVPDREEGSPTGDVKLADGTVVPQEVLKKATAKILHNLATQLEQGTTGGQPEPRQGDGEEEGGEEEKPEGGEEEKQAAQPPEGQGDRASAPQPPQQPAPGAPAAAPQPPQESYVAEGGAQPLFGTLKTEEPEETQKGVAKTKVGGGRKAWIPEEQETCCSPQEAARRLLAGATLEEVFSEDVQGLDTKTGQGLEPVTMSKRTRSQGGVAKKGRGVTTDQDPQPRVNEARTEAEIRDVLAAVAEMNPSRPANTALQAFNRYVSTGSDRHLHEVNRSLKVVMTGLARSREDRPTYETVVAVQREIESMLREDVNEASIQSYVLGQSIADAAADGSYKLARGMDKLNAQRDATLQKVMRILDNLRITGVEIMKGRLVVEGREDEVLERIIAEQLDVGQEGEAEAAAKGMAEAAAMLKQCRQHTFDLTTNQLVRVESLAQAIGAKKTTKLIGQIREKATGFLDALKETAELLDKANETLKSEGGKGGDAAAAEAPANGEVPANGEPAMNGEAPAAPAPEAPPAAPADPAAMPAESRMVEAVRRLVLTTVPERIHEGAGYPEIRTAIQTRCADLRLTSNMVAEVFRRLRRAETLREGRRYRVTISEEDHDLLESAGALLARRTNEIRTVTVTEGELEQACSALYEHGGADHRHLARVLDGMRRDSLAQAHVTSGSR